MRDVVMEVRVMIRPVMTSVMVILYSVMMPFVSPTGGGTQESVMDVELAGASWMLWGGLVGAEMSKNSE